MSRPPFTYAQVGATLGPGPLPDEAHPFSRRAVVGRSGQLDRAAAFVLRFGMQRGAGLAVPDDLVAVPDLRLTMRLGRGPLGLDVPVGVVGVVDEPDRRGFAYGTLPGHPEDGEELFTVERVGDELWAEVRGFSRPGRWYVALGGPVTGLAQGWMARRYLDAVRRHLAER